MTIIKALTPQIVAEDIRKAVLNLKVELQRKREQYREDFHRALITALHDEKLFKKAQWR